MRTILLTYICASFALTGFSQVKERHPLIDTVIYAAQNTIEIDTPPGKNRIKIIVEKGREAMDGQSNRDTVKDGEEYNRRNTGLFGGLTFSRFDIGMTKLLDHGKMKLSPGNDFLSYRNWKSVNVGFDVGQVGYRFSDEFRILLSAGFDWTQFRLKNNVIIKKDTQPLDYEESEIRYSKNRFGSSYLRIPLAFEIRSKATAHSKRFHLSFGPMVGILLRGNQKFKSDEEGKHKTIDDFNYATYRYGTFMRVGYNWFGLYAKYYFNDVFKNSPDQQDLKNGSVGVMFFF